jgi:acetylglutamate kinase
MKKINIIKIGGNILDDKHALELLVTDLQSAGAPFILVHGGGKLATQMSDRLQIETKMIDGRRVTDEDTLQVVTMVYAGWINKNIVALMQSRGINALGLSGADGNLIRAQKRKKDVIDYGYAGDITVDGINIPSLTKLIQDGFNLVFSAITHNGEGQLLNTNADTIAGMLASALAREFEAHLFYCFEKKGVLKNMQDENSVIHQIRESDLPLLKENGIISSGMLPKINNAFAAINSGVASVRILHASNLLPAINGKTHEATLIVR